MIGSGDVALLLGKTQHGTLQDRQAQTRKETDQQTSSKAVFNFFQLGFWVGALVVRRLGGGALSKGITPIAAGYV